MKRNRILVILLSIMLICCTFFAMGCGNTGEKVRIDKETGLAFKLNETKDAYILAGIGDCTDTEIVIPSVYKNLPVTSIGSRAFEYCNSLTSIEIPNSVTSIGYYAFYKCSSLTSIEIPNSVTSIGNDVFEDCSSLANIEIPNGVTTIERSTFSGCSSLTSIEIPDNVTSIGSDAFYGCSLLTSIEISDNVTNIGFHAFYNCSSLTSIEIPNSVISIGAGAFYNCSSLEIINFNATACEDFDGKSPASVFGGAGEDGDGITVTFGNNVTRIPANIFSSNDYRGVGNLYGEGYVSPKIINVTIGENVESIGEGAFLDCSLLTSIEIPDSVTSIGDGAFARCDSLKYNEKDGLKYLGNSNNPYLYLSGVIDKNITTAVIDKDCRLIGSAFVTCQSLTNIKIPNGVTSIGDYAFFNCSSLTSIEIPNSVTSIGRFVFRHCNRLRSIIIPKSVESMGEGAFEDCSYELQIHCEASSKPSDWNSGWNPKECSVEWGYEID